VINFDDVGKTYRGLLRPSVRAVERFSLRIADGDVLGIAGPNGAGKSTLLAMLLGFQYPTSGRIQIDGMTPRRYVEHHGVSYVPELMAVNPRWRTTDALHRFAVLSGVAPEHRRERVESVIALLGLQEHRDKPIKALSKGNAQRVGIAQALLREQRIMVFDEPTHGLDPQWMLRFRDIVRELRAPDRIIIIASHNLDELQRLTDRVVIVDHGQLQRIVSTAYVGTADEAVHYRVQMAAGAQYLSARFPDAVALGNGEFEIEAPDLAALNQGLAATIDAGGLVASVAPRRTMLEAQFDVAVEARKGVRALSHTPAYAETEGAGR